MSDDHNSSFSDTSSVETESSDPLFRKAPRSDVDDAAIRKYCRSSGSLLPSPYRFPTSDPMWEYFAGTRQREKPPPAVTSCEFCNEFVCQCTICLDIDRNHKSPDLCEDCQRWDDINHILYCEHKQYGRLDPDIFGVKCKREPWHLIERYDQGLKDLTFYPVSHLSGRKQCVVCMAVWEAVKPDLDPVAHTKIATWRPFAQNQFYPLAGHQDIGPMEERCILAACLAIQGETDASASYKPLALPLVLHYRGFGFGLQRVTLWDRQYIDVGRVKSWLALCQDYHGKRCNTVLVEPKLPAGFRLIDTFSMCVSEHSSPVTYVALSYLWGSQSTTQKPTIQLQCSNQKQLEEENGLDSSQLPDVIADAIQLCMDIGHRYLWVDRLCIVQDDARSKHDQIRAMDRIYGMALFTIVAATDCASGLPGVSTRPRPASLENFSWSLKLEKQDAYYIWPRILSPIHYRDINHSAWNTRGWTFQERILSRRHLIICDQHIFLSCFYSTEEDDLVDWQCRFDINGSSFEKGLHLWKGNSSLDRYRQAVRTYTSRTLSYASDILNAFAGIESILAVQLETNFVLGLPERSLLKALRWLPDGPSTPRDRGLGVPSWTWAGWDGPATYDTSLRCYHYSAIGGNLVKFHYSDPRLGVRPVGETTTWVDDEDLAEFDDQMRLWLYSYKLQFPRERQLEPFGEHNLQTWRQSVHNPWNAHCHRELEASSRAFASIIPKCLVFNTTCAMAYLREKPPDDAPTPSACFDIVTRANGVIGRTAQLNVNWASRNIVCGKEYAVVVLGAARRNRTRPSLNPPWDLRRKQFVSDPGDLWGLSVMITEREGRLSRRVTVGEVSVGYWTMAMPQWETIFLV
ncbi:hypothetical protein CEP54_011976 [Fusarium duplospermum]|uniref:Heterokaryon incompatibility domain-containing protein n=1 Tax=Fusarium duplospermum TaxID=1325734 RepID=A0A428PB76_9HYPO|nr:hypothetical protein CEP54_011976 [Fusarium duplospermum]